MKLSIAVSCFSLIIFLMLASCSKSPDEPEFISPVAPLVGTWDLTEYIAISKNDPGMFVDLIEFFEFSATIVVDPNGDYTVSFTMSGVTISTEAGRFANMEDFENQMTGGDSTATVILEGNTITRTAENQTWDFGNGPEPVLERMVYTRRE